MQDSVDGFQIKRKNHLLSLTRKKVMRIVAIFLIWSLFIVYICLPISRMKNISINGNVFLSDKKVIEIAHINSKTLRWDFSSDEAEELLQNYEFGSYLLIENANINNKIISVSLNMKEIFPLGIIGEDVLLSNGNKMAVEEYLSVVPKFYQDAVGYIPVLNIESLRENSMENFIKSSSSVSDGFVELRQKKDVLTISNIVVNGAPSDEVYVVTFKEIYETKVINISIKVSSNRFTEKLTYQKYIEIWNHIISEELGKYTDNEINISVDYIGAYTVYGE